jgi:hypothetical protein
MPTTIRPTRTATHVQLTLLHEYKDVTDEAILANSVITGVADTMEVNKNRISNVKIMQGNIFEMCEYMFVYNSKLRVAK